MKVLQINTTVNSGSTGRIAEDIGTLLLTEGSVSVISAFNTAQKSQSHVIKIGDTVDWYKHILLSRILDRHGFGSKSATQNFISQIDRLNPDIIHLHNIHGYYLNIVELFHYLRQAGKPVVWTFHDCWPLTGHCSYFDFVQCNRWKTGCFSCPNIKGYPKSLFLDQSKRNYKEKRELFNGIANLTIVTPSNWLKELVLKSYLQSYPIAVINNGIDLKKFNITSKRDFISLWGIVDKYVILGVASTWDTRKGLADFVQLSCLLSDKFVIVLVGLNDQQLHLLPKNVIGVKRTESIEELAELYNAALTFVNPTYVDNFPTTNLEALACGTPVITYNTGGSPEAIDDETGIVVEKGDINGLVNAIIDIANHGKSHFSAKCRNRAEELYNKDNRYRDYLNLYTQMINSDI